MEEKPVAGEGLLWATGRSASYTPGLAGYSRPAPEISAPRTFMPTVSWLTPALLGTAILALSTPAFACGEGGETNPAVCAVLCANGLDDDGDGYTDGYDSECTDLSTPECTEFTGTDPNFSMVLEQRSTGTYDARHQVAAADLDHDGVVELVIGRGGQSTELSVINAQTMEEESRIPFASGSWQTFDPGPAIGQLDDGPLEVAWISGNGSSDFRLQVARLEGDTWEVAMSGNIRTLAPGALVNDNNTRGWAVSIADVTKTVPQSSLPATRSGRMSRRITPSRCCSTGAWPPAPRARATMPASLATARA